MPLLRGGRPVKAWRYAGLFGEDVMLGAAEVRIGPVRQVFWAVWDRRGRRLRERTRFVRRGRVRVERERLVIADGDVTIDLGLSPGAGLDCVCLSGAEWAWTRKSPLHAEGTVRGRPVRLRGILDESAGYHARAVSWRWSAGVGVLADGREAAWNLVAGINDPVANSERAVWVDGALAPEPGPSVFAPDLTGVDGLRFAAEARRARRDRLGLFSSDYAQPFGTFSGVLPGGLELAEGWGVMERHDVRW